MIRYDVLRSILFILNHAGWLQLGGFLWYNVIRSGAKVCKRIVRMMVGVRKRVSWRKVMKTCNILPFTSKFLVIHCGQHGQVSIKMYIHYKS